MDSRFCGAVAITEKSRIPSNDMPRVRGIGVAVSVKMSTSARSAFSASFCRTPKRCSSSMITRPRRLNCTLLERTLWVPMTISTVPSVMPAKAWVVSLPEVNRDNSATLTGQSANRSAKVCACCSANKVVGQRIATCCPLATAKNAARNATSVLPNPTSPQTSRSIGLAADMSSITAVMAAA